MKKYTGMKFIEWCKLDPDDNRKINYKLYGTWDGIEGQKAEFTSEDLVDYMMMFRLRESVISTLKLINNEWYVTLVY